MPARSEDLARVWLRHVEDDLQAAEALIVQLPAVAAFHIQQAVEKALKAKLVLEEVEPPRTHDLNRLYNLLADPPEWPVDDAWLRQVSAWAVVLRYPPDLAVPAPENGDLLAALASATRLAAGLRTIVGDAEKHDPA